MKEGIAGSDIDLVKVMYGDTGKDVQMKLIDDALQTYPDIAIIGGVAPAIEGAEQILREKGQKAEEPQPDGPVLRRREASFTAARISG